MHYKIKSQNINRYVQHMIFINKTWKRMHYKIESQNINKYVQHMIFILQALVK